MNRLATFYNWPNYAPDKNVLALTGFFSINLWDLVRCHFCSVEIGFWEEGDDAVSEHLRYAPGCDLMRRRVTANVPISQTLLDITLPVVDELEAELDVLLSEDVESDMHHLRTDRTLTQMHEPRFSNEQEHHADMNDYASRLATFTNWPRQIRQKPVELATAGFYYMKKGDRVACFKCQGALSEFAAEDDVWVRHAKELPNCMFMQASKGEVFIDLIRNGLESKYTKENMKKASGTAPAATCYDDDIDDNEVNQSLLCRICYDERVSVTIKPCYHCLGINCAFKHPTCPFCRRTVEDVIKVFL